ncbi:MAG: alpha/beta hydrolase [Mariniphaga sp.]
MKHSICIYLLLLLGMSNTIKAQDFKTFIYYSDDSLQLELDFFSPVQQNGEKKPLVIFVHGGGFSAGNRTAGYALSEYLAERGIAAATISYTLYMKGKDFGCNGILSEKVKAIQIASNQLWLATHFFNKNQEKFQIDTTKIFIAGSSAGAETVLHAAFWNQETMRIYPQKLSNSFRYAGLISGAGAIMDLNLIQPNNLIPVMMFHGDADPVVPYETAAHHYCPPNSPGWFMLFGSKSIYNYIVKLNGTVELISYKAGSHKIAGAHFFQEQQPVFNFIQAVINREHAQIQVIKQNPK